MLSISSSPCRGAKLELVVSNTLYKDLIIKKDAFFDDELRKNTTTNPGTLKTLGYALSRVVAGKSSKTASNHALIGEFGVLKVSSVADGEFREEENKALIDSFDFKSQYEVQPGMILVTRCNALLSGIGRACIVETTRTCLMLSDKTLQLVPNEKLIDKDFLLQGLRENLTGVLSSVQRMERKQRTFLNKLFDQLHFGYRPWVSRMTLYCVYGSSHRPSR
jgi:hypothetical protein